MDEQYIKREFIGGIIKRDKVIGLELTDFWPIHTELFITFLVSLKEFYMHRHRRISYGR